MEDMKAKEAFSSISFVHLLSTSKNGWR